MTSDNLAHILRTAALEHPDRTAIVLGDTRMSYATVEAMSNRVANLLAARGIGPGDTVALSCPNLPHFTIVYFGILKAGAAVVPLNVLLRSREVAYHLADSRAAAYFCFEGSDELPIGAEGLAGFEDAADCAHFFTITADPAAPSPLEGTTTLGAAMADQPETFEIASTDEDDTAVVLYTSGTTGRPKGAELRHRNMRDNARVTGRLFDIDLSRPDTYLCALPLFHSFGQSVIQNGALAHGGTIVMLPRFEPRAALHLMAAERITFFAGVPTMYWALLDPALDGTDRDQAAATLRVSVSGGAALPREVHRRFEETFGITILEGYGLSETSPVASFSAFGEPPRVGSIGTPIPGVEMKLIEPDSWAEVAPDDPQAVGEIAIRGHNVMKGYLDRPEATDEAIRDGWFRTGDLARRDEDGWYYIVDRSKDMILRGGFNVYPREIEEVLMTHPAVSLAAVIGVPHESHGEEIKAVVIPQSGTEVTGAEIVAWCKEQMAAYKYPRIVELVDTLPMTATGKILKRELS